VVAVSLPFSQARLFSTLATILPAADFLFISSLLKAPKSDQESGEGILGTAQRE